MNTDGEQDKRSHGSGKRKAKAAMLVMQVWPGTRLGAGNPHVSLLGLTPGKDPISQPPSVATWLSSTNEAKAAWVSEKVFYNDVVFFLACCLLPRIRAWWPEHTWVCEDEGPAQRCCCRAR